MAKHLYDLKFSWKQGFLEHHNALLAKKKRTEADVRENLKLLDEMYRIMGSLNKLEDIIQQLDKFPKNPEQPGA
jgi:hypothetical protein